MTKNEVIEAVNKYNESLNLTITSLEIDNSFVDKDLDTCVIVKLNLSDGTSEKIIWYDNLIRNKELLVNPIEINGEDMYYMGECYSYYGNILIGNEWPEFCDEEGEYIDEDELTDDEKKRQLEDYADCIDEDFIWGAIEGYENTKWWKDIVEEHTDDSDYDEIDCIDKYYCLYNETNMALTDDGYMFDSFKLFNTHNITEEDFIKVKKVKYYDIRTETMEEGYYIDD